MKAPRQTAFWASGWPSFAPWQEPAEEGLSSEVGHSCQVILVESLLGTQRLFDYADASDIPLTSREKLDELSRRVEHLEAMLNALLTKLERSGVANPGVWVPIESFAPEPYEVLRPFTAVITPTGDEFEASFFDANIHASGDTEEEALANLKATILDTYDRLIELDDPQLGPGPAKQKRALNLYIRNVTP